MNEHPSKNPEVLQILINEHTNLQAMRSATVFEANGRTNLFLGTVSSSIVALAFIGQMSDLGRAFFLFALILFPSLIFLGLVTFIRVNETGTEDMVSARGINRIRHYYTEVAPHVKEYFILSTHDDMSGYLQNLRAPDSILQQFASTAGLVSVINSILGAVFAGLLAFSISKTSLIVCIASGAVIFVTSVLLHMWYIHHYWKRNEKQMKVLFPSDYRRDAENSL